MGEWYKLYSSVYGTIFIIIVINTISPKVNPKEQIF